MAFWEPWRGCRRCSNGCKFCYIHKGDQKRNVITSNIVKTANFYKPIEKSKNGEYKVKSGSLVYLCFSSDFLLEEADEWRREAWSMIKERQDLFFCFLTKRIERFERCKPDDWGSGYENIQICCTVEDQENVDKKLSIFKTLPIMHKCITAQPLLERINIQDYLDGIELVVVGGESDPEARPLDYEWVLDIREQCRKSQVDFQFRQCGTHFIKDGKLYNLRTFELMKQAREANINLSFNSKK